MTESILWKFQDSIFKNYFKKIIFFIPFLVSFIILGIRIFFTDWIQPYSVLIREDGPIEYFTVITYLIAFIFSLKFLKLLKNDKRFFLLYLVFSIGFLVIAMEEISWGQRILDFSTPDWFPSNAQGETSIHNLVALIQFRHATMISVALFGSLSWLVFPIVQKKIKIFSQKTFKTLLRIVIPSKYFIGYFFPIFFVFLIFDLSYTGFFMGLAKLDYIAYESEPFELLLGIGILLFVMNSYVKQKKYITSKN